MFWRDYRDFDHYVEQAYAVLVQVGLADKAFTIARTLPHGDQRKLELALLLATDADLLLLDEPTAGMASEHVPDLIATIERIREETKRTILLVEHNMDVVMRASDIITVMHQGRILAEGTPEDIAADEEVQRAYLGGVPVSV